MAFIDEADYLKQLGDVLEPEDLGDDYDERHEDVILLRCARKGKCVLKHNMRIPNKST